MSKQTSGEKLPYPTFICCGLSPLVIFDMGISKNEINPLKKLSNGIYSPNGTSFLLLYFISCSEFIIESLEGYESQRQFFTIERTWTKHEGPEGMSLVIIMGYKSQFLILVFYFGFEGQLLQLGHKKFFVQAFERVQRPELRAWMKKNFHPSGLAWSETAFKHQDLIRLVA